MKIQRATVLVISPNSPSTDCLFRLLINLHIRTWAKTRFFTNPFDSYWYPLSPFAKAQTIYHGKSQLRFNFFFLKNREQCLQEVTFSSLCLPLIHVATLQGKVPTGERPLGTDKSLILDHVQHFYPTKVWRRIVWHRFGSWLSCAHTHTPTQKFENGKKSLSGTFIIFIWSLYKSPFNSWSTIGKFFSAVVLDAFSPYSHLALGVKFGDTSLASFGTIYSDPSIFIDEIKRTGCDWMINCGTWCACSVWIGGGCGGNGWSGSGCGGIVHPWLLLGTCQCGTAVVSSRSNTCSDHSAGCTINRRWHGIMLNCLLWHRSVGKRRLGVTSCCERRMDRRWSCCWRWCNGRNLIIRAKGCTYIRSVSWVKVSLKVQHCICVSKLLYFCWHARQ